jgi:hypothetical protein
MHALPRLAARLQAPRRVITNKVIIHLPVDRLESCDCGRARQ